MLGAAQRSDCRIYKPLLEVAEGLKTEKHKAAFASEHSQTEDSTYQSFRILHLLFPDLVLRAYFFFMQM